MSNRLVLDTNAVSAVLGEDTDAFRQLESHSEWLLPVIVMGELFYGAYASTQVRPNLDKLAQFTGLCTPLLIDSETATHYGRLRTELRFKGKPIPSNDAWIAALCRQHNAPLLTRDLHFDHVEQLQKLSW